MTSPEIVSSWLDLLNKRKELTEDWDDDNSHSITPIDPYRDEGHLKQILFKRLEDILASLLKPAGTQSPVHTEVLQPQLSSISPSYLDWITDVAEYDSHAVQQYRSLMRSEVRLSFPSELSDSEFLRKAGYLKSGRLTTAGVLLYTNQPSRVIASAVIRCTKYEGLNKTAERSRRNCDGPLLSQIIEARDFIVENTESREKPVESSMRASTVYMYPMICVREVLANAVCHRSYEDLSRLTYVTIYTDRIEIKSPGNWINTSFVEGQTVTLGDLAHESIQRNMRLAHAISSVDMMEMEGSGIPSAIKDCKDIRSPEPTVVQRDGYVIVTIYPRGDWDNILGRVEEARNSEHENILNKGVETWNKWRKDNPSVQPRLDGINISNKHLVNIDFSWINLTDAKLIGADLFGANFSNANLTSAALVRANLVGANLSDANFSDAHLIEANLDSADLRGTIFRNTDLTKTNFTSTNLNKTIFANMNLSSAIGLESCNHLGPCSIDFETLYTSWPLPERFLYGCGVPDTLITYLQSLRTIPLQFFSCFISYSSKDQYFVERLYADLKNKGIRCWLAPEDLKIGKEIHDRINESIRFRDKLILILSKHSISGHWVEHEVESSLEEERQTKRTVIFPIRLDDTVMQISTGWPALIKNTRNIGDFRKWKNPEAYQKAFDRLLRDLKADSKQQTAEG